MLAAIDDEIQVGIRAALMALEGGEIGCRSVVQECMTKVCNALDAYEALLETGIENTESDFIWKSELIYSMSPMVSAEELRTVLVLLKTSPYSDIEGKQLVEVRAAEFYRDCSVTIPFMALVVDGAEMESTLRIVNALFPLQPRKYLKRIKSNLVLLTDNFVDMEIFLTKNGISNPIIVSVNVPAFPVYTKSQFLIANALWPIRITTPLLEGPGYTEIEKKEWSHKMTWLLNEKKRCAFFSPEINTSAVFGEHQSSLCHAVIDACNQVGKVSAYLATKYTVLCLSEPCLMCSMALLHSRVSTVVYIESSAFGGLGTVCAVHTEKNLNHKFRVFKFAIT